MDTCPKCGQPLSISEYYETGGKMFASLLCGDFFEISPAVAVEDKRREELASVVERVKEGKANPLSLRRYLAPRGEGKTAGQILKERRSQNG